MLDPHTSNMRLVEIADSLTFVKTIYKLNVQTNALSLEILVLVSLRSKKSNFLKILEANLPKNASLNYIPDPSFKSSTTSMEFLCKSVKDSERNSFQVELLHKKFALAAASACISYVQGLSDHAFVHDSFIVKYESSEDTIFISTPAIENLELIDTQNSKERAKNLSLFKFLNFTVTKMGQGLLKNNILQPLNNKTSLFLRYEAVKELIANDDMTAEVRNKMKQLVDVDTLFSYLCKKPKADFETVSQQKINFVLLLKRMLTSIANIRNLLKLFECDLIKEIVESFENEDIDKSSVLISDYINEDYVWVAKPVYLRKQKCYAVKVGYNGTLDASRQLYKTLIDEILEIIETLSEDHNLLMESKYDKNRGFYILVKNCDITFFEEIENNPFIDYIQKGANVEVVTMKIVKLNLRITSVLNKIFLMTEDAIDELINQCRKFVASYFLVLEAFALLGLMCTFAKVSTRNNYEKYICSEIDEKNTVLKGCRHPILEYIYTTNKSSSNVVVPNGFTIVSNTSRVQIITGPNMGGKSIYIKEFALVVILAQIGMLVFAEYSSLKIFKSLFTRISNDATEPNMSTFSMEMQEMSFILQNANKDSLIIIDELGRGTSYKDGVPICISMLERISILKSACLFVTHFVGIPLIFQNKPGLFQMHVWMSNDSSDKFKMKPGINWTSGYGIDLVESSGLFPDEIIKEAKILLNKLKTSKDSVTKTTARKGAQNTQNKLILNTYEMLQHILHNVPDNELHTTLSALENEFVDKYDPSVDAKVEEEVVDKVTKSTVDKEKAATDYLVDFRYLR